MDCHQFPTGRLLIFERGAARDIDHEPFRPLFRAARSTQDYARVEVSSGAQALEALALARDGQRALPEAFYSARLRSMADSMMTGGFWWRRRGDIRRARWVLGALALVSCTGTPPSVRYEAWNAPRSTGSPIAPIDDGQIAEIAEDIDAQQVPTARLGEARGSDPEVRDFAEELLADHEKDRKAMLARVGRDKISLQMSILGERFESQERDARAWLSNETGVTFDRDFLGSEVKEQKRQIDLLDHVLIPGAADGALVAELRRRRAAAALRLDEAERLALRFPLAP